jgi:hypothetical protein
MTGLQIMLVGVIFVNLLSSLITILEYLEGRRK